MLNQDVLKPFQVGTATKHMRDTTTSDPTPWLREQMDSFEGIQASRNGIP
jgi:hypothetical protein